MFKFFSDCPAVLQFLVKAVRVLLFKFQFFSSFKCMHVFKFISTGNTNNNIEA